VLGDDIELGVDPIAGMTAAQVARARVSGIRLTVRPAGVNSERKPEVVPRFRARRMRRYRATLPGSYPVPDRRLVSTARRGRTDATEWISASLRAAPTSSPLARHRAQGERSWQHRTSLTSATSWPSCALLLRVVRMVCLPRRWRGPKSVSPPTGTGILGATGVANDRELYLVVVVLRCLARFATDRGPWLGLQEPTRGIRSGWF